MEVYSEVSTLATKFLGKRICVKKTALKNEIGKVNNVTIWIILREVEAGIKDCTLT